MGLHWRLHLSYALSDYYQAGLGLRNEGKYHLLFWLCIPSVVVSIVLSERFGSIGHCLKALLHCLPYRLFRNRPKIRRWNLRHSLRLSLIKSPNLSNRPKHWKVSPFATQNSARVFWKSLSTERTALLYVSTAFLVVREFSCCQRYPHL